MLRRHPGRVLAGVCATENELCKLGIPVGSRHNEVAPGHSHYGDFSEREQHSRFELAREQYALAINVEAKSMQEIASTSILPAAIRTAADTLEALVADDLWPLPNYEEMLFIL